MLKRILLIIVLSLLILPATRVGAVDLPSFPTCVNPHGTVQADYADGTHGIPGSTASYTGSDTVYNVDSNNLIQCFCSNGGQGVQTNWLKADTFSDPDLKILETQGWIYIPDGSAWGLENVPYLAQSYDFACASPGGGGNSSGNSSNNGSGGGDGLSDGRSDGLSSCPSCTAPPQVLAAQTGEVLGLAATGDSVYVISVYLAGLLLLSLGLLLHSRVKHAKTTK